VIGVVDAWGSFGMVLLPLTATPIIPTTTIAGGGTSTTSLSDQAAHVL
jgi:hypothetical protein